MEPIGKLIEERLREKGVSISHLARVLLCDRSNIYRIFQKESIDTRQLLLISRALDYDFFSLYSGELTKK